MTPMRVGFLHPGEMGVSLAATVRRGGHQALWASEGRSAATLTRATEHGLVDAGTVKEVCGRCDLVVSICPPHAAEEVAEAVMGAGFAGVYLEANAVAPERAVRIAERLTAAGIEVVDGGVVGGPAWREGTTLYLSGARAAETATAFAAGPLAVEPLGPEVGRASALKMVYAARTKGTTALELAVLATAERLGVRAPLEARWAEEAAGSDGVVRERARRVTRKAWRFAGGMEEIAATFASAGLPDGIHRAAAELYRRLAGFKDAAALPAVETVLAALVAEEESA